MSPWNTNEDPLGGGNGSISSKIMEYVRGANPITSHEEVNATIKMYWRNIRRKKKEENICGERQLDARQKKNKRDRNTNAESQLYHYCKSQKRTKSVLIMCLQPCRLMFPKVGKKLVKRPIHLMKERE